MEPKPPFTARRRGYAALGAAILLTGVLGYLGLVDPHRRGAVLPACPFRLLTGWNCPACGGLRMIHDLLHGDLAGAVVDNVFLLIALPLLAVWVGLSRGRPASPLPTLAVFAAATVAWTVLRNLPGFPLVPTINP